MTVLSQVRRTGRLAAMIVLVVFYAVAARAQVDPLSIAEDGRKLPVLKSGWYLYEPYQFIATDGSGVLSGIDIGVAQELARRLGYFIQYDYIAWADQIAGIRNGTVDFAEATPTEERSAFAHFSKPYRTEEVVLLVHPRLQGALEGRSTSEIVAHFKAKGLRLGVVDGFVFGSEVLNTYVAENRGTRLVAPTENSTINLRRLLDGEIDGFLEDRLAGIDITSKNNAFDRVAEIAVDATSDITFMFSKANFSPEMVRRVNAILQEMLAEGLIEDIRRQYLVPLFLSQTTGSTWYKAVDLLGTIAFALSGTILAWRIGANLAGFFLLSALPAVGGGMTRDIILARPIAAIDSVVPVAIITAVSVLGYIAYSIHRRRDTRHTVSPAFASAFNLFDAAGLGSFTVTGIAVTISDPHQHSIAWAPFFGVLTAAGGGIARDALVQRSSRALFDDLYMQISLFWGGLLTIYVALTPTRMEPNQYELAMWGTVVVIVVTRLGWLQHKRQLFSL